MKKPYFSDGSDAMLALEGMIDLAGTSGVLYAMSIILRRRNAIVRAMQIENCAASLGIVPANDNILEFTIRNKDGSIIKL